MAKYDDENIFLEVTEDIRKINKMTIEKYIDGITSERSYRRYLNHEENIPVVTLSKLMKRLNLSIADIIIFSFSKKLIPSGIVEFFNHQYKHEYEPMKEFYKRLKTYDRDRPELNLYVSLLVKKYESSVSLASLDEYHQLLKNNWDFFMSKTLNDNVTVAFLGLWVEAFHSLEGVDEIELMKRFHDSQFYFKDLYLYYYTLVLFLDFMLTTGYAGKDAYLSLAEFSLTTCYLYFDLLYHGEGDFHYAVYAKMKFDDDQWKEPLFRHLMNHQLLWKSDQLNIRHQQIKDIFNIDVYDFIEEQTLLAFEKTAEE